jgi:hypothetical protein
VTVRNGEHALPVGHVIHAPRHGRDDTEVAGRGTRELGRLAADAHRLDAPYVGLDTHERRDLALVAAEHGHLHLVEDSPCGVRAIRGRTRSDRVENDRHSARVRSLAGGEHRLDPRRRQRADVDHERSGQRGHLLHLLPRV